jgi:hypothetical protein
VAADLARGLHLYVIACGMLWMLVAFVSWLLTT